MGTHTMFCWRGRERNSFVCLLRCIVAEFDTEPHVYGARLNPPSDTLYPPVTRGHSTSSIPVIEDPPARSVVYPIYLPARSYGARFSCACCGYATIRRIVLDRKPVVAISLYRHSLHHGILPPIHMCPTTRLSRRHRHPRRRRHPLPHQQLCVTPPYYRARVPPYSNLRGGRHGPAQ